MRDVLSYLIQVRRGTVNSNNRPTAALAFGFEPGVPFRKMQSDWAGPRVTAEEPLARERMNNHTFSRSITFRYNYPSSGFNRPITEYYQDRIRRKLELAGVTTLTVIIKQDHHYRRLLDFEGDPEEVFKAKNALVDDHVER